MVGTLSVTEGRHGRVRGLYMLYYLVRSGCGSGYGSFQVVVFRGSAEFEEAEFSIYARVFRSASEERNEVNSRMLTAQPS